MNSFKRLSSSSSRTLTLTLTYLGQTTGTTGSRRTFIKLSPVTLFHHSNSTRLGPAAAVVKMGPAGADDEVNDVKVKVAAIQMTSTSDKNKNLMTATKLIKKAAANSAKMIFLPECFDYVAQSQIETAQMAEGLNGPIITIYQQLAKKLDVWLSLGGFHLKLDEKRSDKGHEDLHWVANTHIIINSKGEIVSTYKKIHLFDYSTFKESNFVKGGTSVQSPVQTPCGQIGLGICYDLRFPEFSQILTEKGAQILTYPSAFTVTTGEAHWETLLRARAIETQCYVIAAAQVGHHNQKRSSYGHTMIVNPWGTVEGILAEDIEDVLMGEINLKSLNEIRKSMPVQNHRRPQIYYNNTSIICHPKVPHIDENNKNLTFNFGPIQVKRKFLFYESEHSWACVNRKCVKPGHVLVMPKIVAKRLQDLSPHMISDLFNLASKVQNLMEFVHKANSSTITVQDGPDAGQTVPHLHIHIIPRKPNDFEDNDEIYQELAKHDKVGQNIQWRVDEEMEKEAQDLRQHLNSQVNALI